MRALYLEYPVWLTESRFQYTYRIADQTDHERGSSRRAIFFLRIFYFDEEFFGSRRVYSEEWALLTCRLVNNIKIAKICAAHLRGCIVKISDAVRSRGIPGIRARARVKEDERAGPREGRVRFLSLVRYRTNSYAIFRILISLCAVGRIIRIRTGFCERDHTKSISGRIRRGV